ncbi:MAG: hypothetical protein JKY95_19270 [Planctomycetaceae bacterium]|nr:hypothetical protein [Planctomycetaceae bacterium]
MFFKLSNSKTLLLASLAVFWATNFASVQAENKKSAAWELRNNDRVVFLGSTFIERENTYAMMEMSLRLANPNLNLSVRNLGWAGDNVLGESRAYFGSVAEGYAHLKEYVKLTDPTLLIVSYGHNAAFAGEAGLGSFIEQYAALLKDLQAENRRIVVLGTTPLEGGVLSQAEVDQANDNRRMYGKAIASLCASEQIAYVDILDRMLQLKKQLHVENLTTNGLHLNRIGYAIAGEAILNSQGKSLVENNQLLLSDSQFRSLSKPLEQGVLLKNELFFHRFRPQNETYLRGFRKHEQGQNAKEIYEFDALVIKQEQTLAPLTKSVQKAWWK